MGGSGGRGFFPPKSDIGSIKAELDRSIQKTKNADLDTRINQLFTDLLSEYNDRDVNKINKRLETLKKVLEKEIEGSIDMRFGGSIRKRTFVDGLSDVDSLLILNKSELKDADPRSIRQYLLDTLTSLKASLKDVIQIRSGNLAVTVDYEDEMQIQLLPALKRGDFLKISSSNGARWAEINPQAFTDKLTGLNSALSGKLIPTIKLIKVINYLSPQDKRMENYHVESLAVQAFKDYSGPQVPRAMLEHFFDIAKESLKTPIKDSTGQSVHTDDYLGPHNSAARRRISDQLDIISRKIKIANDTASIELWKDLLGEL